MTETEHIVSVKVKGETTGICAKFTFLVFDSSKSEWGKLTLFRRPLGSEFEEGRAKGTNGLAKFKSEEFEEASIPTRKRILDKTNAATLPAFPERALLTAKAIKVKKAMFKKNSWSKTASGAKQGLKR